MTNTNTATEAPYQIDGQKWLNMATRAYNNTSFDPERRGRYDVKEFEEMATELQTLGATNAQLQKFEWLFVKKLNSQANCISSAITGGSNFPVARAEKANNSLQKRYRDWETDRKSTRLNSSHSAKSRMPSSA